MTLPRPLIGTILLGLILTGCVSGKPQSDTYTSTDGVTAPISTDYESCIKTCNDSYVRCGDIDVTRRGVGIDAPTDLFGANASCKDSLKKCLPRCKGR